MVAVKSIGWNSHVILCSAVSGSGTSVTYSSADDETYQFIKAKTPAIKIKFGSKITEAAYHKSRQAPDLKYSQGYDVSDGKFEAKDVNKITEWLMDAYIAKARIYLLVDFWNGSAWTKKSWYDSTHTKVYYLKGVLRMLDIKQDQGNVWKISFQFAEVWN